jgi:hypothetical protein
MAVGTVNRPLLLAVVVITAPIWIVLVLVVGLWIVLRFMILYALVWSWWIGLRRKRTIFVYSNSPTWQQYLERNIVPHLPASAVVLNWSERQGWPRFALPVLLFRFFGGRQEFNPMGLVFERFRPVRRYRFWQPFRDFKHGHMDALGRLQADFLDDVTGQQMTAPDAAGRSGSGTPS